MSIASSIAAFEGAGARVKLGGANVSRRSRTSSRSDRSLCCSWEDQQREMIRRRESSRRTGCPPSPKVFRRQPHVDTKEEASPTQNDEEEDAVSISSSKADNNEAYRWAAENNSFSEISYDSNDSISSLQMESKQDTVTDHRPLTSSPKKNMLSPRKMEKSNLPPQLPRRTKSLRQSSRASGDAVASKNQKQVSWNEKIKVKCDSIGALPLEHEDDPKPNKHDVQTKKPKQVVSAAKTCSPKVLVEKRRSNDSKKSISKEAAKVARARTVQEPVQKRGNNDAEKKLSKEAADVGKARKTPVDNDDENWQVSDMCLTGPIPYFVLFQTMRVDKLCFLVAESHAESLRNSPVVAFNCSFPLQRDDAYEVQHFFKTNNISKNNVCLSCEVITGYPKQFASAIAQQLAHRLSKLTSPCS